jgi:hypothetical protein
LQGVKNESWREFNEGRHQTQKKHGTLERCQNSGITDQKSFTDLKKDIKARRVMVETKH